MDLLWQQQQINLEKAFSSDSQNFLSSGNPTSLMTAAAAVASSKPKSVLVYVCKQCNIYFPTRPMLESHDCKAQASSVASDRIKVDPDSDGGEDVDDENSWEVETLDENLLLLLDDAKRKCPYCSFGCDNSSTYRSHVKRKHYEYWLEQQQKQHKQQQKPRRQAKSAASSPAGGKMRSCPHCSFETRTKSTLYSHISRSHKNRPEPRDMTVAATSVKQQRRQQGNDAFAHTGYACNYCTFAAATMSSLKCHSAREHGAGMVVEQQQVQARQPVIEFPVEEFDCDQCSDYKSKSRKAMQRHLKAEHQLKPNDEGMFSCHLCSYESTSKMGVQRHISIKHDKPRREAKQQRLEAFACEACGYRTYNAKVLEWHAKRHHVNGSGNDVWDVQHDYFCNDCDFATWTKAQLLTHIKRNHKGADECGAAEGGAGGRRRRQQQQQHQQQQLLLLQCDLCDYTTKNKHVMKVHVIRKHTEGFNHTCELCGKKYKVKADLTNHMRFQHREQPIICDVCGKECRNSNLLYLHQKFAHYKPEFECKICKRRMVSQANLDEHVLKQHEQQKENVMCEECGKTFTRQSRLKIHMRIHLGLRPYTCKICGKSFARRNGLRQHLLIHTGQRPYVCDICGKDFTQKTGLISHRKSHPGSHPPLPRITIDHVLSSLPINY